MNSWQRPIIDYPVKIRLTEMLASEDPCLWHRASLAHISVRRICSVQLSIQSLSAGDETFVPTCWVRLWFQYRHSCSLGTLSFLDPQDFQLCRLLQLMWVHMCWHLTADIWQDLIDSVESGGQCKYAVMSARLAGCRLPATGRGQWTRET